MLESLAGGIIIGLAASTLLLLNGRIAGVSGIVGGALAHVPGDVAWRLLFVAGVVSGGLIVRLTNSDSFRGLETTPTVTLLAAGFLVGFGTSLGSGCTSGHGVCGVSRLSPRSIVATLTFMLTGILTVFLVRHVFGATP